MGSYTDGTDGCGDRRGSGASAGVYTRGRSNRLFCGIGCNDSACRVEAALEDVAVTPVLDPEVPMTGPVEEDF
jgi:hypothetical protein